MGDCQQFGCAVIGVGWMGERHARVWAELPMTRLVCVYDVNATRAKEIAQRYGAEVAGSLEEAVDRQDVHIVSVCTPDDQHLRPCLAAAQAGKHLLVEKPLATNLEDADAIIDASRKAGVKLMVGHILRFDPRYAQARQLVAEGAVGDLIYVYARRYNVLSGGRRVAANATVASFLGIHDIDAIQWITGRRITAAVARGTSKLLADVQAYDVIVSLLEIEEGACGCIESLWVNPEGMVSTLDARLEIVGTKGRLDICVAHDQLTVSDAERTQGFDTTYGPVMHGQMNGALRAQMEHFALCVANDLQPAVSGEEARQAVAVVQAIHEALRTGQAVRVP